MRACHFATGEATAEEKSAYDAFDISAPWLDRDEIALDPNNADSYRKPCSFLLVELQWKKMTVLPY